ncbi:MAG: serine/threonine protein kinase [Nannocystaceae bacterium]|nr:serine/threonine protein kinase [Nannocystaceae bacterium]
MTTVKNHSAQAGSCRLVTPAAAPREGEVIADRYTVQRLIARGGMGDVYLASRSDGGADVALKMLSERWLDDSDAVARFEREGTRLRSVEHPNVVLMHDSGIDQGRPYLVMEYIDGEPLNEFLERRGALTLREFVPIAAQLLKGMGHAHLREMMIRDVKPSNIMLCTRKGRANFVKLLDFGLAKFTSKEPVLTEGHVLGTAGYLAPEAIRGEELDLRVDVYAIGVVFYQMLSGALPFENGESATLLYKTLDEAPRPLGEMLRKDHDIPDALLALVSDCLEKDRALRPNDANIIVERLIDAVPASHFRLPTSEQSPRSPGYGNSGLMELVRTNPSSRFPPHAAASHSAPALDAEKPRATRWLAVIGVAVLASLATASAVVSFADDASEADDTSAEVVPAAIVLVGDSAPPDGEPLHATAQERPVRTEDVPVSEPANSDAPNLAIDGTALAGSGPEAVVPRQARARSASRKRRRRQAAKSSSTPVVASPEVAATEPVSVPDPTPAPPPPEAASPGPAPAEARRSVFLSADRDETSKGKKARPSLLPAH